MTAVVSDSDWIPSFSAMIPGTGLLFGLILLAAILGGYFAHAVRLPRVVGYLAAGIALKILLYRLLDIEPHTPAEEDILTSAAPFKAIKDLGLGVILFSIGGLFEARHLKSVGGRILKIALGESGLTFLLVFLGTAVIGLLIRGQTAQTTVWAFAFLLGLAAIATAPAATLFVLREYDAKGPNTDAILSLTGLNNIVCIVTFYMCFSLLAAYGVLDGVTLGSSSIWIDWLALTLGSLILGTLLGFGTSVLYSRLSVGETLLILVAGLIVIGAGEGWLLKHHRISYNFLLTTLFMGATFANIAIDPNRLEEALQSMSRPVLIGFFGIAGYQIHLLDLAELRFLGIAYIVCRIAGKILGARLAVRRLLVIDSTDLKPSLGSALLCQAAVVIGLADFVVTYWHHPWADRFATVVLGSIVIFEICGPLFIKEVVKGAGEVKAITLLRRTGGPSTAGNLPILSLSWHALLRVLGWSHNAESQDATPLQACHIMRTQVKCIPADADLHEVLRIIERSRFNHFPVVDTDQKLVGVIHFGDIREILYDPFLTRLMTAIDLANPDSQAVPADMPIDDVFVAFRKRNVGSLPVVTATDTRHVVGIIEQRDLLRAIHQQNRPAMQES